MNQRFLASRMTLTITEFLDKYGTDTTNNFQLIKYAKDLNIKPFYCIMRNELKKLKMLREKNQQKYFIVCNYQTTKEQGTHWVALYKDCLHSYYFDSFSIQPFPEAIDFLENGTYSNFKIQPEGSKMCGILCLWVLYQLAQGKDFYETVLDLDETKDSFLHK